MKIIKNFIRKIFQKYLIIHKLKYSKYEYQVMRKTQQFQLDQELLEYFQNELINYFYSMNKYDCFLGENNDLLNCIIKNVGRLYKRWVYINKNYNNYNILYSELTLYSRKLVLRDIYEPTLLEKYETILGRAIIKKINQEILSKYYFYLDFDKKDYFALFFDLQKAERILKNATAKT